MHAFGVTTPRPRRRLEATCDDALLDWADAVFGPEPVEGPVEEEPGVGFP